MDNLAMYETANTGDLLAQYARMESQGVEFFVDGAPVVWDEAYWVAVREDCVYMADYISDGYGKISEVRLDKINGVI